MTFKTGKQRKAAMARMKAGAPRVAPRAKAGKATTDPEHGLRNVKPKEASDYVKRDLKNESYQSLMKAGGLDSRRPLTRKDLEAMPTSTLISRDSGLAAVQLEAEARGDVQGFLTKRGHGRHTRAVTQSIAIHEELRRRGFGGDDLMLMRDWQVHGFVEKRRAVLDDGLKGAFGGVSYSKEARTRIREGAVKRFMRQAGSDRDRFIKASNGDMAEAAFRWEADQSRKAKPMPREPSVKETFTSIRALGLSVKREDGEWRVRVPGRPEADYFTDDNVDALATARHMAKGRRGA